MEEVINLKLTRPELHLISIATKPIIQQMGKDPKELKEIGIIGALLYVLKDHVNINELEKKINDALLSSLIGSLMH